MTKRWRAWPQTVAVYRSKFAWGTQIESAKMGAADQYKEHTAQQLPLKSYM